MAEITNKGNHSKWFAKHKVLTWIIGAVAIIILVAGGVVLVDHNNYQQGNRSLFFGTIDTYSQNQTLKFNNLNVRVTNTIGKNYSVPSPQTVALDQRCQSIPFGIDHIQAGCIGDNYNAEQYDYQHYQNITVWFSYQNISKQSLDINAYKFKLAANTSLNNEGGCDMQQDSLLQGPPLSSCLFADIDNKYSGPLSLLVTHNGKTKGITITLPKISSTINQD